MTAHFVHQLDELRRRSLRMASMVEDIVEEACEAMLEANDLLARRVISRDEDVDAEEVEVEAEIIRLLALHQPVGSDLRLLCTLLKVNNDLERIADCAVNIAERAKHLNPLAVAAVLEDLRQLCPAVRRMLRRSVQALTMNDSDVAQKVQGEDEAIDAMYGQIIRSVIANASASPEAMAAHLDVLSVAKNLERIADHATNIAEDVVFLATGKIVRHQRT